MVNHLRLSIPRPAQGATRRAAWLSRHRGLPTRLAVLLVMAFTITACKGGGASGNPGTSPPASQETTSQGTTSPPNAACQPHGAALRITARGDQFDQQCLAAPANTPLVITFVNQDQGVAHNLAIYSDPQRTRTLFRGKLFQGVATVVYHVPPLPANSYFFQCDVHLQTMTGTLVVG